jgi:hypothetical protein
LVIFFGGGLRVGFVLVANSVLFYLGLNYIKIGVETMWAKWFFHLFIEVFQAKISNYVDFNGFYNCSDKSMLHSKKPLNSPKKSPKKL